MANMYAVQTKIVGAFGREASRKKEEERVQCCAVRPSLLRSRGAMRQFLGRTIAQASHLAAMMRARRRDPYTCSAAQRTDDFKNKSFHGFSMSIFSEPKLVGPAQQLTRTDKLPLPLHTCVQNN